MLTSISAPKPVLQAPAAEAHADDPVQSQLARWAKAQHPLRGIVRGLEKELEYLKETRRTTRSTLPAWEALIKQDDLPGLMKKLQFMVSNAEVLQGDVRRYAEAYALPAARAWLENDAPPIEQLTSSYGWLDLMTCVEQAILDVQSSPDPSRPIASSHESLLWRFGWEHQPWTWAEDIDPSWKGIDSVDALVESMAKVIEARRKKSRNTDDDDYYDGHWYRMIEARDVKGFIAAIQSVRAAACALDFNFIDTEERRPTLNRIIGLNDFFSPRKFESDPMYALRDVVRLDRLLRSYGNRETELILPRVGFRHDAWQSPPRSGEDTFARGPLRASTPMPPPVPGPGTQLLARVPYELGNLIASKVSADVPDARVTNIQWTGASGTPEVTLVPGENGKMRIIHSSKVLAEVTVETIQDIAAAAEVLATKTQLGELQLSLRK